MDIKPLTLLLIEDNIQDCINFENCVRQRNDVKLVAITNSDIEGLDLIKKHSPDVIILDIELHKGSGNSTSFSLIETLHKMNFKVKPKIIVTTVVTSNTIYDYLHEKGVDLIFYKKQKNYSIDSIINTILLLRDYSEDNTMASINMNNNAEFEEKISHVINNELDLIGIGLHLQGRKYLYDAIYFIITEVDSNKNSTVVQYLVNKYKMTIPEVFDISENYFRERETECCQDASLLDGYIISTGGGVVKKEENIEYPTYKTVIQTKIDNSQRPKMLIPFILSMYGICFFASAWYIVKYYGLNIVYILTLGAKGESGLEAIPENIGFVNALSYCLPAIILLYCEYGKSKILKILLIIPVALLQIARGFRYAIIQFVITLMAYYYIRTEKKIKLKTFFDYHLV